MKTILITGSGGFIGANCKSYLEKDYHILAPRSYELDLRNPHAVYTYFSSHQIDYIIHCATVGGVRGYPDIPSTVNDNLSMVDNLLMYKNSHTPLITFGSGAMYGRHRPLHKVTEDEVGVILPQDLYGLSKVHIAQRIIERDDAVCFIIFACYGYREKESRFPTYALTQNINMKPIIIERDVIFDYLFVEDMQTFIALTIKQFPSTPLINMTPTLSISLSQLAQIANQVATQYESEIVIKNPILQNEYTGDNSKLREEFPSVTFTTYAEGMRKLYQYLLNIQKIL